MEYVDALPSASLSNAELEVCIRGTVNLLNTIWQVTGRVPGPVDGGEPQGPTWAPYDRTYERFPNVSDLEGYINRAAEKENRRLDLKGVDLVFCHLDVALRNTLLAADSTVYILDWADAGFYPRFFELWKFRVVKPQYPTYYNAIQEAIAPPTAVEEDNIYTMWVSYRQNMLHHWSYRLRPANVARLL